MNDYQQNILKTRVKLDAMETRGELTRESQEKLIKENGLNEEQIEMLTFTPEQLLNRFENENKMQLY